MATNNIESTLVAAYSSDSKAQAAVQELERAGISRDQIHIHEASRGTTTQHQAGFTGWLKSLFGEDEPRYLGAREGGNTIVAVDASNNQIDAVADILDRYDPIDLQAQSTTASAAGAGAGATTSATSAAGTRTGATEGASIPVVEEQIAVGKRSYQRGGVRIYSRVIETPVEENVLLREERVYVERQPVNRPATEADLRTGQEQVVEVNEYSEEPVIEKRARVVEEVRVGKDVSERTEAVRDTVRRTEVDVEPATVTEDEAERRRQGKV
jgi:uncharacterized protein (TIGR02271 family)